MLEILRQIAVKVLFSFMTSNTIKESVKYGAKKLVEKTNTGIDDALAESLLGDIKSSNRNKIKEIAIEEAKTIIVDGVSDLVYDITK